jgi:hypothetical protein
MIRANLSKIHKPEDIEREVRRIYTTRYIFGSSLIHGDQGSFPDVFWSTLGDKNGPIKHHWKSAALKSYDTLFDAIASTTMITRALQFYYPKQDFGVFSIIEKLKQFLPEQS